MVFGQVTCNVYSFKNESRSMRELLCKILRLITAIPNCILQVSKPTSLLIQNKDLVVRKYKKVSIKPHLLKKIKARGLIGNEKKKCFKTI